MDDHDLAWQTGNVPGVVVRSRCRALPTAAVTRAAPTRGTTEHTHVRGPGAGPALAFPFFVHASRLSRLRRSKNDEDGVAGGDAGQLGVRRFRAHAVKQLVH